MTVGEESPSDFSTEQREAANGLRQYDYAIETIRFFLDPERPFALRPGLIQELQAIAVDGLIQAPGKWRTGNVGISKSQHQPCGPHLVPMLVTEMCDYVNDNWHEKTAFHLAAFIMWRLNWIHPFPDGNGRTSRTASYIILNVKLATILPGYPTIPQQIQEDRTRYFRALEAADCACRDRDEIDVSEMEMLLRDMLARQLVSVIEQAQGGKLSAL